MFEIGCLAALDHFFDDSFSTNDFDIYVGISAGAIVGALLANGYRPQQIYDDIRLNQKSILNFKRKNVYNLPLKDFVRSVAPLFRRLPSLIRYGWVHRQYATLMDLVSVMQEFLPPGLFSLNNLHKFVASALYPEGKTNDFRNLSKELYIPATKLDNGERWVFGDDDRTVPISRAVTASAAIPLFFRPVRINGEDFIDGSTGQVSHVDIAIRKGAKLVVIINPTVPIINDPDRNILPTFDGTCGRLSQKGMGMISDQARRIETRTRFEFALERFTKENPEIDIIRIEPKPSDGLMFLHGVMEFDSRRSILEYGYYTTVSEMKLNQARYGEVFKRHQITLRETIQSSSWLN